MFFKVLVRYTTSCCVLSNHACNVYIFPLCDGGIYTLILFLFIYLFLASTPPRSSTPSGNMAGKLLIVILFIYYYYYYFLF